MHGEFVHCRHSGINLVAMFVKHILHVARDYLPAFLDSLLKVGEQIAKSIAHEVRGVGGLGRYHFSNVGRGNSRFTPHTADERLPELLAAVDLLGLDSFDNVESGGFELLGRVALVTERIEFVVDAFTNGLPASFISIDIG